MDKLKQSPAEILKTVEIGPVERECLDHVFEYMIKQDPKKPESEKRKIGHMDVARVLQFLGCRPSKSEVKLIIWEVDDDLDGYVSREEFLTMYKRCITDKLGLEPRKLFNLVQFLMYDKEFKGTVTVEETLQILFVRYGRDRLDEEIRAIFGDDEKDQDGVEKSIRYSEYVEKINKRALAEFKHREELKNKKKIPISGMDDDQ